MRVRWSCKWVHESSVTRGESEQAAPGRLCTFTRLFATAYLSPSPSIFLCLRYFVGNTPKEVIERVMATAPGGDFVVRLSERVPNSLVLMLKTSAAAGVQRRIVYGGGRFSMDIRGSKCSHECVPVSIAFFLTFMPHHLTPADYHLSNDFICGLALSTTNRGVARTLLIASTHFTTRAAFDRSLTQLLQMDPTCRRPMARAVLDAVERGEGGAPGSASSRSDSTRSSGGGGGGGSAGGGVRVGSGNNPPGGSRSSSSGGSKKKSSREVLENAMTAAERGDFATAFQLAEEARTLGASPRNLDKAIGCEAHRSVLRFSAVVYVMQCRACLVRLSDLDSLVLQFASQLIQPRRRVDSPPCHHSLTRHPPTAFPRPHQIHSEPHATWYTR